MAEAKTDEALVLKVPRIYHHNQGRYFQVVELLNLVDNPDLREKRLEAWGKELLDPKTAGVAAHPAGRARAGRRSRSSSRGSARPTRGAVLRGRGAGLPERRRRRRGPGRDRQEPPRIPGLRLQGDGGDGPVGLAAEAPDADERARPEVRYGAFNALRTLDPNDPFLGKVRVLDARPSPSRRRHGLRDDGRRPTGAQAPAQDPFSLYVVDSDGPPMIHVAQNIRCEIVVFGKGQKLLTPIVLGAGGPLLLNASDGDEQVQICKIVSRGLDGPGKINRPLEVASVVRAMTGLGASYPDVVAVLALASAQKNLPGASRSTPSPR